MKTKNLILFILISSFFLIFIFGLLISFANLRIGSKIKIFYKSIIFSLIFVICDGYIIQKLPLWYNIGIFLILYFFVNIWSKSYNFGTEPFQVTPTAARTAATATRRQFFHLARPLSHSVQG